MATTNPNSTRIVTCSCAHEYQDKIHGKQRRVANWAKKKEAYICTVCGAKHSK